VTGDDLPGGLPAGGGNDDEAAWRDLVARFDAPVIDEAEAPWPERENLTGGAPGDRAGAARRARADTGPLPAVGQLPSQDLPQDTVTSGYGPRDWASAEESEHYVPPAPPPLPKLDPVTKGAWAALFGGPAYLLLSTAIGWNVPGVAAFCAVAAFIGGFAVLVLRMDDGPPKSGPDDGAVV
jgi:hypothetical protein